MDDLLGEALHHLHLTGALYCRAELTAPWAVAVPPMGSYLTFQVVTAGRCVLEVGGETRTLTEGSLTLIPHGAPHVLRSGPGLPTTPLFDIPVDRVSDHYEIMRHGGGGAPTQLTYGVVHFAHPAAHHLLAQLPDVLTIDAWDEDTEAWLHTTIRYMAHEARALRPGGETVMTRLADVLVIQAIRTWLARAPEASAGWLAAIRDPHLGRALAALHRTPSHPWTVATLAAEATMSRSTFAAKFASLTGIPPMQYLTRWRMHTARATLAEGTTTVATTASRVGYQSEAAFSRAYKRTFGTPPSTHKPPTHTPWPTTPPALPVPYELAPS
ncbi:AraC family transcriptional regulator [Actinosynnema sp. NPDC020468]|uniref:AraC family transcriptional regulator n=1 Tax=Actinosynnema sp. NPDC020468 TaxID=3154488 RepID=UPI0033C58C1B